MIYSTPPQVPVDPVIAIIRPAEKPKPEPVLYTFISDDVLERVATSQNTTVQRIFDKNPSITNPDVIDVGQTIEIPSAGEQLTHREMPVSIEVQRPVLDNPSQGFFSSGNTYDAGQCVWYIKNIVPWVRNGWGNANQWVYLSGHKVSSVPMVGAVASGIAYSHVALVTGVSGNNVTVTEMNYIGEGKTDTRTAPISEFQYLYP